MVDCEYTDDILNKTGAKVINKQPEQVFARASRTRSRLCLGFLTSKHDKNGVDVLSGEVGSLARAIKVDEWRNGDALSLARLDIESGLSSARAGIGVEVGQARNPSRDICFEA